MARTNKGPKVSSTEGPGPMSPQAGKAPVSAPAPARPAPPAPSAAAAPASAPNKKASPPAGKPAAKAPAEPAGKAASKPAGKPIAKPEPPSALIPKGDLTVHPGPFTLALDIGGTGTKAIVLDALGAPVTERARLDTPRPATPKALLAVIEQLVGPLPAFDRVSVGFPGVVQDNVVRTAPNLDGVWTDFPLGAEIEKIAKKPTRVLNDAGVQGFGIIEGKGVELVLTFGTGMGTALYLDGRYVPNLELAHHPLRKGRTYEETVDNATLERIGKRRWRGRVARVVSTVLPIWNPRMLYLGGGNARHLKAEDFPANVKIGENIAGLLGGIALWKDG